MNEKSYKTDFPIYDTHPDLVYLDSAATALTPQIVLDKMSEYYNQYGTNVSRGIYEICEQATAQYENVRQKAATFVNATTAEEIVFTNGTTHSLNILAHGIKPQKNDLNVAVTTMDHHANFVPWQLKAKHFSVVTLDDQYNIDINDLREKITSKTDVLAFPYISNVLGTINPVNKIVKIAKKINPDIITVLDAAQAAPHIPINVQELGCDFLAFSGHKVYGPTGTGILWGKKEQLEKIKPLLSGGDMISAVTAEKTTLRSLPYRLEAGTPNIAGIIGMGKAFDYLEKIGFDSIKKHEQELKSYTQEKLQKLKYIEIHGPRHHNIGVISFSVENIHPHDIASILDTEKKIAIRAGNHCAMPLHNDYISKVATNRISLGLYNTKKDIDILIEGLKIAKKTFGA